MECVQGFLRSACNDGHETLARVLLDKGADVNYITTNTQVCFPPLSPFLSLSSFLSLIHLIHIIPQLPTALHVAVSNTRDRILPILLPQASSATIQVRHLSLVSPPLLLLPFSLKIIVFILCIFLSFFISGSTSICHSVQKSTSKYYSHFATGFNPLLPFLPPFLTLFNIFYVIIYSLYLLSFPFSGWFYNRDFR